jgi:pimeloyl-ACP methyl ester carboxylesterase
MSTVEQDVPYRECMVETSDAAIHVGEFGAAGPPTILLISGMGASMDWWPDGFCRRLAVAGRHVVRYDHRDTGTSTTYPVGEPGYTLAELFHDPLAVLTGVGVPRAHLVGISMGGGIAQHLALEHAEQVASLTLISTASVVPGGQESLPPMRDELRQWFEQTGPLDWSDRDAVTERLVASERAYAGAGYFDGAETRKIAESVIGRSTSIGASLKNHGMLEGSLPGVRELDSLDVPTLVIHGAEDPFFPPEHGEALARSIPRARLLILERVGHQIPPPTTWDVVVPALIRHTGLDISITG